MAGFLSTLGKVFLIVVSLGIGLAMVNFFLVFRGYQMRPYNWIFRGPEFIQTDDYFNFFTTDVQEIWTPRPNTVIVPDYWETDAEGFRVNPTHRGKQPTGDRVLVIGDSFVYGHGVSHTEAWPAKLEANWRQAGWDVWVDNAGVPASGTDQQFLRLRKMTARHKYTRVIWALYQNDIRETNTACLLAETPIGYVQLPAWMNIAYVNAKLIKYLPNALVRTAVGNLMTTTTIYGKEVFTIGCSQRVGDGNLDAPYERKLTRIVAAAEELAHRQGFSLTFVIMPHQKFFEEQIPNYDISWQQDIFHHGLEVNEAHFIDLNRTIAQTFDPYIAYLRGTNITATPEDSAVLGARSAPTSVGLDDSLFLKEVGNFDKGEWHLNVQGNELVAKLIQQFIDQDQE